MKTTGASNCKRRIILAFGASGRYSLVLIIATRRYSLRLPPAAFFQVIGGNVILSRGAHAFGYRLVELF
jgi:hypothetical protein